VASCTVTLAQGSTSVFEEPFGSERGPVVSVWNVKGAKVFTFKERFKVEANFQVYNLLNSNAAVSINWNQTTPATFNTANTIVAPRVFRIGGIFSF